MTDRDDEGVGVVDDDTHPESVVPGLLRRLVLLGGLLAGFLLAGLLLAGPAQAASDQDDSSGGGSTTGTVSSVVHAVTGEATPAKATPAKATPAKATPAKATPAKATPVKANPVKATPAKANPVKANPAKANPVKATPAKANPVKATSAKATPARAESGAAGHNPGPSATSKRTTSPVPDARPRLVDHEAVVPRLSTTRSRTLDGAASAVASTGTTATATATAITSRAADLPTRLGTAVPTTAELRSVLVPAAPLTSAVTQAVPAAPSLLAPVVVVPRTLLQPSGVIDRTGGFLVGTVTGLTDTTRALTGTVGALGNVIGLPPVGPATPTGAVGTVGAGARTAAPTLALAPERDANRFPAAASTPMQPVSGGAHGPGAIGAVPTTGSGAPWSTVDSAAGPVSRHGLSGTTAPRGAGAPAPWDPAAPVAPVGTAGAASVSTSANGLTGLLTDPLAVSAILAGLVLLAYGCRRTWWFPELAIGPD